MSRALRSCLFSFPRPLRFRLHKQEHLLQRFTRTQRHNPNIFLPLALAASFLLPEDDNTQSSTIPLNSPDFPGSSQSSESNFEVLAEAEDLLAQLSLHEDPAFLSFQQHQPYQTLGPFPNEQPYDSDASEAFNDFNEYNDYNDSNDYIYKLRSMRKIDELYDEFAIFSGTSCQELSNHVSMILQKPLSRCEVSTFADSEISVNYLDNIRGRDVYIIQATCEPIHDNLMQLLLLISSARRSSARKIIAIIPYYGYGRQDRRRGFDSNLALGLDASKIPSDTLPTPLNASNPFQTQNSQNNSQNSSQNSFNNSLNNSQNSQTPLDAASVLTGGSSHKSQRETIAASDVAKLLECVGVDHVVTVDIHRGQVQGFFDVSIPVDNLETLRAVLPVLLEKDLYHPTIVCPSDTGVERAKKLLHLLQDEGINPSLGFVTSRTLHDATIEFSDLSSHHRIAGSGVSTELIGEVSNRDVIIVDDMIDTGARLINAAWKCKREGAQRIFAFATHGVFSQNAMKVLDESPIDEVFVTNTIFPPPLVKDKGGKDAQNGENGENRENRENRENEGKEREEFGELVPFVSDKVSYVSVGPIIAEAIRRIQVKNSLSSMTHIG